MGVYSPLVVAGVAAYVVVAYFFWETFRAYFDWTESLAITIKVRYYYCTTAVSGACALCRGDGRGEACSSRFAVRPLTKDYPPRGLGASFPRRSDWL